MKQLDSTGLKRLHREWRRRTERRLALVLDGVQQPFNVGSIVRSAAVYRVDDVWLAGRTPDVDGAAVAKTALGTDRYLRAQRVERGVDAVAKAHDAGYHVIGIELANDAKPLHELALPQAVCLVVGHEDHGIPPATLAACNDIAYLPQLGRVGSLNVAVATAIALYETRRQEWTNG